MDTQNELKPGDRYGRLTVVSWAGKNSRHKSVYYCDCDCGNKGYLAELNALLDGTITSCNHCRQKKNIYGRFCPYPCRSCYRNNQGLCCHECDKEATCKNACQSSSGPFPGGCGRDSV